MGLKISLLAGILCLASIGVVSAAGVDFALLTAVKNRQPETVRALLKQRVDVNAMQGDGATALHWAAYFRDLESVDLLLRAGAKANVANVHGVTPLSLACVNQEEGIVRRLLDAGADPNIAQTNGETPLMTCARTGAAGAVKSLLARGAGVDAVEKWNGQTALMWAVAQRHPAVVQALLEGGASVKARSTATRVFVNTGGTTAGKTTTDADFGGSTPLLFAARCGDIESARLLLAAGADVNERAADGSDALVVSSLSGHSLFAAFLLDQGADPDAAGAGYSALHASVLRNDVVLLKALLSHRANPNARITRGTPIPRASQYYVFSTQVLGATPFFLAAKYAEPELMRVLAAAGADTRQGLADGTTPALAACGSLWVFAGSEDRRERALAPDVLTAQRQDETPTFEAVKLAVELGSDVNGADKTGQTPLHAAAMLDFLKVVQFLVDRGARVDARNAKGQTPLTLAIGPTQDPRTSTLLRTLGAKE